MTWFIFLKNISPKIASRPDVLFLILVFSNAWLAYGPEAKVALLCVGLFGLALPLGLSLAGRSKIPAAVPTLRQEIFSAPISLWLMLGILILGFHLYRLTSFVDFPLYDGLINAFCAQSIHTKGPWHLFFYATQLPPFYIWLLALDFKLLGVSFFSLWLLPALLSISSAVVFYFLLRRLFSKSTAFLGLFLMGTGFWPVLIGHFSHQAGLMVLWEILAFAGLAFLSQSPSGEVRATGLFLLGLWTGLGFYTYFGWPLVALLLMITVGALIRHPGGFRWVRFFWFLLPFASTLSPQALAFWHGGYGSYLKSLFPAANHIWSPTLAKDYFTSFFWKGWSQNFAYNPAWGGFLNPVLSSFFMIGCLDLWRNRNSWLSRWISVAFLILFIPILLADNHNWFHVAALLPIFLTVILVGFQSLWLQTPPKNFRLVLILLLFVSMVLDGINLNQTSRFARKNYPSQNLVHAHQQLEKIRREEGPGLLLTNFAWKPWTPYLRFDAWALGPRHARSPRWAAVLTNVNYQPFLKKRFPACRAFRISSASQEADGGLMLWVLPFSTASWPVMKEWARASATLNPIFDELTQVDPGHSYKDMADRLRILAPSFSGDRFLLSVQAELLSQLQFHQVLWALAVRDQKTDGLDVLSLPFTRAALNPETLLSVIQDLKMGLRKGYPAAHLYYQLGVFEYLSGKPTMARKAFLKARSAPLNLTASISYISVIDSEKDSGLRDQSLLK